MQGNFVPLAIAIITLLAVSLAIAWHNPPRNKFKFGFAIAVVCLVSIGVMGLALPESGQGSPLFALGFLALLLLCAPLIRRRFRSNAEAQETFEKLARKRKWKPPLWWSPLLIIGGFVWFFFSIISLANTNSSLTVVVIVAPFVALIGAGVGVVCYRLWLWQLRLMLDNRNDTR
jgi:hypothetical protein